MPVTNISQEAERLYEKAMDLWGDTVIGQLEDDKKRNIAALLALAIKKAGNPFPLAEAKLGLFLYFLGDKKDAIQHANLALQYDSDSFLGQFVRVLFTLENIRVRKLGLGDFFGGGGSLEGSVIVSGIKTFFSLAEAGGAAGTQKQCKEEILRLIEIYRRVCLVTTDVDEYLQMSQLLIVLGDIIKDIPIFGGRPNLFIEVVNSPIIQLEMGESEQEVEDMRLTAEGKSELFKP